MNNGPNPDALSNGSGNLLHFFTPYCCWCPGSSPILFSGPNFNDETKINSRPFITCVTARGRQMHFESGYRILFKLQLSAPVHQVTRRLEWICCFYSNVKFVPFRNTRQSSVARVQLTGFPRYKSLKMTNSGNIYVDGVQGPIRHTLEDKVCAT